MHGRLVIGSSPPPQNTKTPGLDKNGIYIKMTQYLPVTYAYHLKMIP